MKTKIFLLALFSLLTGTFLSAQVQLDKKSTIFPGGTNSKMWAPGFAVNTRTGDTLIMWSPYLGDNSIRGLIVNKKGKNGKPFTFPPVVRNSGPFVYNPNTNEFLIAFTDRLPGTFESRPFVLRLNSDGHPVGKPIDIISHHPNLTDAPGPATIKFNPITGGYILVSYDHGIPEVIDDSFFYCAHLNEKGQLTAPLQQITRENHIFFTDIEYLPSAKKLLFVSMIFWDSIDPSNHYRDYALATVRSSKLKNFKKADFTNIGRVFYPDPGGEHANHRLTGFGAALAFASVDSAFTYFTDNQNIKGQKIDADGKLSGTSFKAFNPPIKDNQLLWPSAAFSETSAGVRGILIAIEHDNTGGAASIWAQVLNKKGKPSGSPVKLYTTADTEEITVGRVVIIPSPVKPGDPVAPFVLYALVQRHEDFNPSRDYAGVGSYILKLKISLPEN